MRCRSWRTVHQESEAKNGLFFALCPGTEGNMPTGERKAVGIGMLGFGALVGLASFWPDLAMAGVQHSPPWSRAWVDAALCFAPLLFAPVPAVLGVAALDR